MTELETSGAAMVGNPAGTRVRPLVTVVFGDAGGAAAGWVLSTGAGREGGLVPARKSGGI